jgi:hypothetical protein
MREHPCPASPMATPRELRQAKLSFLLTMGIFAAFLAPRASYLQVIPKLVLLYGVLNALGSDEVVAFPPPAPRPPPRTLALMLTGRMPTVLCRHAALLVTC